MSVPKAQRNDSEMEFLHNARTLLVFTLRKCKKIPKRFTFTVSNKITDLTWEIFGDIKRGNSIYPSNVAEVQLRRNYFLQARAKLFDLVSKIEIAAEFTPIDSRTMQEWMCLVNKEIALIKGVLELDKKRYKNL